MQSSVEGNTIMLRLEDGEDVFQCLKKVVKKHKVKSAVVVSGIGMLKNFELGYFDGERYHKRKFQECHELLSMHGTITTLDEISIHLHCSLSNKAHQAIGGHLTGAKVGVLNEICLLRLDEMSLSRKLNPKTGLKELIID